MKRLPRLTPPRARFLTPQEHGNYRIVDGIRIIAPGEQMGLAPLAIAAGIKVAGGVAKALQGSDPKKNAGRDAKIAAAEGLAMQGNVAAAAFVRQQTGHGGTKFVPAIPQIGFVGGPVAIGASDDAIHTAQLAWQRILKGVPQVAAAAQAYRFTPAIVSTAGGVIAPIAPAPGGNGAAVVATPGKTTIEKIAEGIQNAADTATAIVAPFIQPPAGGGGGSQPITPMQPQPPAPDLTPAGNGKGLAIAGGLGLLTLAVLASRGSSGRGRRGGRR